MLKTRRKYQPELLDFNLAKDLVSIGTVVATDLTLNLKMIIDYSSKFYSLFKKDYLHFVNFPLDIFFKRTIIANRKKIKFTEIR